MLFRVENLVPGQNAPQQAFAVGIFIVAYKAQVVAANLFHG